MDNSNLQATAKESKGNDSSSKSRKKKKKKKREKNEDKNKSSLVEQQTEEAGTVACVGESSLDLSSKLELVDDSQVNEYPDEAVKVPGDLKVKLNQQTKTGFKDSKWYDDQQNACDTSVPSTILEQSEENPSPNSSRKKKKRKKAKVKKGFLLSSVLSGPQEYSDKDKGLEENGSDKDAKESPSEEESEEKKSLSGEEPSDLLRFTKEDSLLAASEKERNNFLQIVTLIYGVGLQELRKLFMDIHPNWSNKPVDARNLEKGVMKLKGHEHPLFDKGDVNKWDISLITTVLLYSKKCKDEISKRPGFEDAIRAIKDSKNQLISHTASERMSDEDFLIFWSDISNSLNIIGAKPEDIEDIRKGDILETGKFYRDLFLEEIATRHAMHSKLFEIDRKVDILVAERNSGASKPDATPTLKDLSGPKWDEWLRFCDRVHSFDYHENNYILITDAMSPENVQHFSPLRSVPWKVVLDFDPSSEEKGMYYDFIKKEGKNSLINMITPDEIRRQHTSNLARHLDTHKTQWMFVNGREKDSLGSGGPQTLQDWKGSSVKQITRFFSCCSDPDKLDKHKPIICLVLPCRKETVPFLTVTLDRLKESFDDFSFNFVSIKQGHCEDLGTDISITDLPPDLLSLGLTNLFQASSVKEYRLPTSQANLPVKLTQNQYLFLQEYLDVLYDGCEDLPDLTGEPDGEEIMKKTLNEHRMSFMSGNWISFLSLFDNHDARRELGNEVRTHIQRLLDQGPTHSTIVEICHSPGTGGSTIARRVLWDLHKSFPCAFANLEGLNSDYDDDLVWINGLADRISDLQEICRTIPLILLDGKHARMEAMSNKLVRALNNRGLRVVLLRCLHRSKGSDIESTSEASDVHARFSVNVKLEESKADLNEFEAKYKDFIDDFMKNKTTSGLCRVFHFPLIAMLEGLEGFSSRLKQIVFESFEEMNALEKEIAVLVAFIQKYAAQVTPASLLYEAFKPHVRRSDTNKGITYEDINQLITEQLLNLMVPAKPAAVRRRGCNSKLSSFPESYTLQHPLVADLVLKKVYENQKRDIIDLTRQFLEFPIFEDERFFSLMNDIFIRNRSSAAKARFSILFEELKSLSPIISAEIFCEVAEKTKDAIMFGHAARFHTKKNPPSFSTARELIAKAFQCKNARTKIRSIYDIKGGILQNELKFLANTHKIDSLSSLEKLADEALQSYKNARNFPPTFPNPLLGEVKVWIACIEWITKYQCKGDSDETIKFINSTAAPSFFRTCVGDSFHLLDIVDGIVQSAVTLPDPEETQRQANSLRVSLMRTFNKGRRIPMGRKDKDDVIQACMALCSTENFPKTSHTELKRLQAQYIISCVDQIETIKKEHLEFLAKLLESLVLVENQCSSMAYHLMKVCLLITDRNHYSLDKGLQVAEKWIKESSYDPLPYFYQMMIYFLKILDGNHLLYRDSYHKAIKMCQEKSQHHCKGVMPTHFLKRNGEGMNRLMTRSALLSGETEYPQNVRDFWTIHSRKKLLECRGRIRVRQKSGRRKQVYIELVQGNIELYVGKNADIGHKVDRDFSQGSMLYFVVSFNLQGPVANGITLTPVSTQVN